MTIDNMAYDMIENVQLDMNQYNDFLRMMDDYKAQLYMDYINKEYNQSCKLHKEGTIKII
jgi:hypothetical protein